MTSSISPHPHGACKPSLLRPHIFILGSLTPPSALGLLARSGSHYEPSQPSCQTLHSAPTLACPFSRFTHEVHQWIVPFNAHVRSLKLRGTPRGETDPLAGKTYSRTAAATSHPRSVIPVIPLYFFYFFLDPVQPLSPFFCVPRNHSTITAQKFGA